MFPTVARATAGNVTARFRGRLEQRTEAPLARTAQRFSIRVRKHPVMLARCGTGHGRERDRPLPRAARTAYRGAAGSNGATLLDPGAKAPGYARAVWHVPRQGT